MMGSQANGTRAGPSGRRVVFFGMPCAASVPPLLALLAAGYDVPAILLPASPGGPPHIEQPGAPDRPPFIPTDLGSIAARRGIPVLAVPRRMDASFVARLAALRPAAIVVACFPWRLPETLLELPPLGCLNVHPSLLPVGRGPEPVFWTLRRGDRRTGVTIHRMDAGLDTGPIAAQAAIAVPDGIRAPDLEWQLMRLGGDLLVRILPDLAAGTLALTAQDDARATPAPIPTAAEFAVPTNLPARWAYNFVRGVAPLGGPLELLSLATGARYPLADALAYEADARLAAPDVREGGELIARFKPGSVRFKLAGGG